MPMYQTRCKPCNRVGAIFRKIAERDDLPACEKCGGELFREIVAPAVFKEFEPFLSPVSGKLIDSRNKRREDMLATGSIDYEPGMKKEILTRKADLFDQDLQKVDKIVDDVVCALNVSGRLDDATGN